MKGEVVSEGCFFSHPWTTAAVTYHPDYGILSIAPAFQYENGNWGYPPHATIPVAAMDFLEGSYLAFVRGVPPDEIGLISAVCASGDFLGALSHLGLLYMDAGEPIRGIGAATGKRCQDLHDALSFMGYSKSSQKKGGGK